MFGPLVELIECQDLYNVLNEGIEMAKINDLHYLYLLGSQVFCAESVFVPRLTCFVE